MCACVVGIYRHLLMSLSTCSHIEAACMGFLPFVHRSLLICASLALTQTDRTHGLPWVCI